MIDCTEGDVFPFTALSFKGYADFDFCCVDEGSPYYPLNRGGSDYVPAFIKSDGSRQGRDVPQRIPKA